MTQKKSEFNKVLNAWDILVIAFGAMIGWGWVVSTIPETTKKKGARSFS
jgi:basic amino acid/polyamine antiporter, APA family